MDVTVKRSEILPHLRRASSVADKKSVVPIFANVLVKTIDDALLICAEDHIVALSAIVPCELKAPGAFCVLASELSSLVNGLGDEIRLGAAAEKVVLKSGKSRYTLRGTDPTKYPKLPDPTNVKFYEVDSNVFRTSMGKTLVSVCDDSIRFHLGGMFFESDGDRFRMVSTDGHRLSKVEYAGEGTPSEGVIIPKRGLTEIKKVLAGSERVQIAVEPPLIFLATLNMETVLAVKLIDAKFPSWQQVIPKDNDKILKVDRQAALAAFKRSQFASTEFKGIKLSLEEGLLRLEGSNPELGTAEEELTVNFSGDPLSLNVNPVLITDYLASMEGESVIMAFKDNRSQILISSASNKDYLGVVMPMQPT